jgi:dihydroorotate dehydrogenase subfamily 2
MLPPGLTGTAYKSILKPILFQFDAESVHNNFTTVGKLLGSNPVTQSLTALAFNYKNIQLTTTLDGINFPNPVGLPAGFDYNGELTDVLPAVGFGWHTIGTVTFQPYAGNKKPRLGRFPDSKALLVNKGLKSEGALKIIQKLEKKTFQIPTGISIASTNTHFDSLKDQLRDIANAFVAFEESTVAHDYYELNISCPNTFGGEPFTVPERLEILLKLTDSLHLSKPVYVKMPIDQDKKISMDLLSVIDKHNIQGVIMGNLTKDHTNPLVTAEDREKWNKNKGNLSGKPTWNRSNDLISLTKKHFKNRFTIVGTGGIFSGEDAQHKMELGSDLVQLITGMIFEGPQVIGQINKTLIN